MRVLIDAGNTALKFVRESDAARLRITTDALDSSTDEIAEYCRGHGAVLASVVPATTLALRNLLGDELLVIDDDLPCPLAHPYSDGAPGIDRRLHALGGLALADSAVIVISCGSAITVDRADPDAGLVDGAILPGVQWSWDAFTTRAGLSPGTGPFPWPSASSRPVRSTVDSLAVGVHRGLIGAIDALVGHLAGADDGIEVYAAGGDAQRLAPSLARQTTVVPDLLFEGMRVCLEDWRV